MIAAIQRIERPTVLIWCALAAVVTFLSHAVVGASPVGVAFVAALAIAPILLYCVVKRPLIFPLAFLVIAVPFEELAVIPGVGTLSRILGFLTAVALIISLLLRGKTVSAPRSFLAWGALLTWIGLSSFWSLDQNASLLALSQNAELVALIFLVSITPADEIDIMALVWAAVIGGIASAAFGSYLFVTNPSLVQDGSRLYISVGKHGIDPNHYANGLILAIAILLMSTLAARNLALKIVFALATIAVGTGVFLSLSRETFLALLAVLVYFGFRSRHRLQAWVLAGICVGGAVLLPNVMLRFTQAGADGGAGRTDVWAVGLEALRSNWLLGAGAGAFSSAYDLAFLRVFQPHFEGWSRAAHNTPLQLAVELGIVGFALAAICWLSNFRLLKMIGPESKYYDLRIALEGSLAGLAVASFFVSLWTYKYVWIPFALIAVLRAQALMSARSQRSGISMFSRTNTARTLTRTALERHAGRTHVA